MAGKKYIHESMEGLLQNKPKVIISYMEIEALIKVLGWFLVMAKRSKVSFRIIQDFFILNCIAFVSIVY